MTCSDVLRWKGFLKRFFNLRTIFGAMEIRHYNRALRLGNDRTSGEGNPDKVRNDVKMSCSNTRGGGTWKHQ
jgi:hypothetical protein